MRIKNVSEINLFLAGYIRHPKGNGLILPDGKHRYHFIKENGYWEFHWDKTIGHYHSAAPKSNKLRPELKRIGLRRGVNY